MGMLTIAEFAAMPVIAGTAAGMVGAHIAAALHSGGGGAASLLGQAFLTPGSAVADDFGRLDARAVRAFDPDYVSMKLE